MQIVQRKTFAWSALSNFPGIVRDGACVIYFAGRTWLYGGWNTITATWSGGLYSGAAGYTTNESWVSDDLGNTWTSIHDHVESPPTVGEGAWWGPRHTHVMFVATIGGTEYLYCIGGDYQNGGSSDVWRTTDGLTWTRMSAALGWGSRFLHMGGTLDGNLYVMGGQTDLTGTAFRDVWRSTDGGATWTQLDDAPWLARGMVYDLTEYRGYLWLVGGGTYDASRTYFNDVWRFDGTTWIEVLANGHAQWEGREYHNVRAFGGRLWLSGGYRGANRNDVYSSSDGETWAQLAGTPWAAEHAAGLAVTPRGLVHATGNAMDQAVYRLGIAA